LAIVIEFKVFVAPFIVIIVLAEIVQGPSGL